MPHSLNGSGSSQTRRELLNPQQRDPLREVFIRKTATLPGLSCP
jgi:hypothetical protein